MTGRMTHKRVLISGGASGIGAGAAKVFVAEGADVFIADIDEKKGSALATSIGGACQFIPLDVREFSSWREAIERIEKHGPLTTLVNSAGVSLPGSIEDTSLDDFRHITSINLEGTFLGCKAAIEAMKVGQGGSIVNIGSTMSKRGSGSLAAYCASKGGVHQLTKSVALHCMEKGYDIRVNTVLPGAIHTEMVDKYVEMGLAAGATKQDVIDGFANSAPMKRLGRPDEVARAILYLSSDEASYSTGTEIAVDGGFFI